MIDVKKLIQTNAPGVEGDVLEKLSTAFQNAINQRVGEVHGEYDQDISSILGRTRPQGIKTYDWLKTELQGLKDQAESGSGISQEEYDQLKTAKADLEKQIAEGKGDTARIKELEASLQQTKSLVSEWESKYNNTIQDWEKKYQDKSEEVYSIETRATVNAALAGAKFRDDIPESLRTLAIQNATGLLLNGEYKIGEVEGSDGTKVKAILDKAGNPVRNSDNGLAPYSPSEFILSKLGDVIDKGRQQAGAGSGNGNPNPQPGSPIAIQATTQKDASATIRETLVAQGIQRGTDEFTQAFSEAWEANKIAELPVQ